MDYNFDAMDKQELWEFWESVNTVRPIRVARELFPERPKGFVRVTKNLGYYASNKAVAVGLRIEGKIETAMHYESICDRIYKGLPDYAKW